ncbi:MAG TPA: hypothetical protein VGR52_03910 [Stellaceae bacterium]|nr:hypothetical protein [Stellaceae bacterium]
MLAKATSEIGAAMRVVLAVGARPDGKTKNETPATARIRIDAILIASHKRQGILCPILAHYGGLLRK